MDDWQKWRKQQRTNLITLREMISTKDHHAWSATITTRLQQGLTCLKKKSIGFYLPIRNEYDPRPAMNYFEKQGATLAVPEITKHNSLLCFKKWWHKVPIKKGAYGIPVPNNTEQILIDVALIPMVGFDPQGYRLGYGGGYYDRTLASTHPPPLTIGIAFEICRLNSVFPQIHDISMDYIITEAGIFQNVEKKLIPVSTET